MLMLFVLECKHRGKRNNVRERMARKVLLSVIFLVCAVGVQNQEEFVSQVLPSRKVSNMFTYSGKTYYVDSVFHTNFYRAMQFCRQLGMHLLSITNEGENEKIGQWIKEKGFTFNRYWTSAQNVGDRSQWIWMSSGNDVTYFKWYPGEPNKHNNSENCIEVGWFGTAGFTWNDLDCLRTDKHFICEATSDCYKLHC